ncbi:C6 zinc finger domain protein [Penicillium lagena]|uniref:C6 zinc finger domain protein n=1 Tax=Penicillium lagena TaxID=94218 RepID=UPI002541D3BC|nr:C6 zinc finger domain protein [Penicillium lagena]KAJ5625774.1 C6 zinc finger domain protein [Penicillium lagena]
MFVGLISCLLFICIESIQGGVETASQLYSQGLRLILAFRAQLAAKIMPATNASLLEDVIVPIFLRLGSIALPLSALQVGSLLGENKDLPMQGFDSLKSARDGIVLIAAETQVFQGECVEYLRDPDTANKFQNLSRQQSVLSTRLKRWRSAFINLVDSLRRREVLSPQQTGLGALLFASYEALFITLRICLSPRETDTDAYIPNFQNIVEQSEIALDATARPDGTQPPYTFELSVGLPLWFTCSRCREPKIRRTALALLRRAPRVLGFYQTRSMFTFGEQVMALEERYGMAMNTGQARASFVVLKSTDPSSEYQPDSQGTGNEVSKFDLSTLVTAPDDETIASIYSMPAGFENSISTSMLIPEEARMGPIKIFRPQDGLPEGTTEKDIAKWKPTRDQLFLRCTWNERDPTTDTWRRVHEYIPTTV